MEFSSFKIDFDGFMLSFNKFHLSENSINVIVGTSGTGKTTLLKYLHGVYECSPKLNTAYISAENYFLFKSILMNFDSFDNRLIGYFKILFDESLDFFQNHKISDLSFGQKTRFKLLRSSLSDSEILLYDEPTHGLDQHSVDKVIRFFLSISRHRCIVITTHENRLIESAANVISL
jgi:ABC-type lipoprotein export system ATPase subunit